MFLESVNTHGNMMPVYVPHGNSHPNLGDMRQSMQDETFLHNAYTGKPFQIYFCKRFMEYNFNY